MIDLQIIKKQIEMPDKHIFSKQFQNTKFIP